MDAIVYTSNTGNTRRYAEMLGQELQLPVYTCKEAKALPDGSEIIYLGWLFVGNVKGYASVYKRLNARAVITVGMTISTEKQRADIVRRHLIRDDQELFCLRGGFDISKLRGIYRYMMRSLLKNYKKQLERQKVITDYEQEMLDVMMNGGDFVSRENLDPIIAWYREKYSL